MASRIDPKAGAPQGIFDGLGMDQEQGLGRVADQHPLADPHLGAGIYANPIAHASGCKDRMRAGTRAIFSSIPSGRLWWIAGRRIGDVEEHSIHAFFQDREHGLGLGQMGDLHHQIPGLGDEVLQGNDGPVPAPDDYGRGRLRFRISASSSFPRISHSTTCSPSRRSPSAAMT